VEVAGVWNDPHGSDPDNIQGGRFYVNVAREFHPAKAAPGEMPLVSVKAVRALGMAGVTK